MVETESSNDTTTITLRPNRSASWLETRIFVAFLCITTLSVGIFWALLGAWVILPFSGLEAILIIAVFYRVSLDTYRREIITLSEDIIQVQAGIYYPKRTWKLSRSTASLLVKEPEKPMDNVVLTFLDHNLSLPLGRFLNREDRYKALQALKSAGLRIRRHNDDI